MWGGDSLQRIMREILGLMKIFYIMTVVMVVHLCIFFSHDIHKTGEL